MDNDVVYLSITDASKKLGIGQRTLKNWCNDNKIPYIRIGAKRMIDMPQTLELLRSGGVSQ